MLVWSLQACYDVVLATAADSANTASTPPSDKSTHSTCRSVCVHLHVCTCLLGSAFVCFHVFFQACSVCFLSCVCVCVYITCISFQVMNKERITLIAGLLDNPYHIPAWSYSELSDSDSGTLSVLECKSKLESSSSSPEQVKEAEPGDWLQSWSLQVRPRLWYNHAYFICVYCAWFALSGPPPTCLLVLFWRDKIHLSFVSGHGVCSPVARAMLAVSVSEKHQCVAPFNFFSFNLSFCCDNSYNLIRLRHKKHLFWVWKKILFWFKIAEFVVTNSWKVPCLKYPVALRLKMCKCHLKQ